MELTQLYQFSVLARMGSVTRAAQKLYITQPALSNTIARLENELGVRLFDRLGNRIRLNAAGVLFQRYVENVLTSLDEGVSEVRGLESNVVWDVSYAVPNGGIMTEMKRSFITEHPEIRLHQYLMSASQARDALLSGTVQFALSYRPIADTQIQWNILTESEIVLLVSSKHPLLEKERVTLADVAAFPLLISEPGQDFTDVIVTHCRKNSVTPQIAFSGDEPRLISALMRDNRFIFITHRVVTNLEPPVHQGGENSVFVAMRELHVCDFKGAVTMGIALLSENVLPRYAKLLYDYFFHCVRELDTTNQSPFNG